MERDLRILILEDEPADEIFIVHELQRGGLASTSKTADTWENFEAKLTEFKPHLVLSDHKLPGYTGTEALAFARRQFPELPFILVTGALGEERAVEAIRAGATDYVLKDCLAQLVPAVLRAMREAEHGARRHEAEERYRSIFENAIEGIFQTTLDGRYLTANPALARMFGYGSPEELIAAINDI